MEKLNNYELLECSGGALLLTAKLIMKVLSKFKISIKAVFRWSF